MGVPTSEVGYTSAMPRREDHEVHKDMWGHWGKNKQKKKFSEPCIVIQIHEKYQQDAQLFLIICLT